mmetsp:Transcript_1290/g.1581  ORF Transcript_1290/g.1581 Transcript_1290/m.1581 type:complete len:88 (+) Transcript_1290:122-385(+)
MLIGDEKNRVFQPEAVIIISAAIVASANGGEFEKALRLVELMLDQQLKPDLITFNAAVSTCGQPEKAEDLIKKMNQLKYIIGKNCSC